MNQYEELLGTLRRKTDFVPRVAIVLGSGLGDFADRLEPVCTVDYQDLPGFPQSTVSGHKGRFVFARIEGVPCVLMQGRVHYYEGYPMSQVILPIRLMRLMGAQTLILTNAAGAINSDFSVGDLMMIRDHLSFFVPSPLIGPNDDSFGPRFPDMSTVYDPHLQLLLRRVARTQSLSLREGVYCQLTGPCYETPAEIRACRILGADAVGMSTACEAAAARHAGFSVCGISCISNMAAGILPTPLSHEEVTQAGKEAAPRFRSLLTGLIAEIGKECSV